VTPPLVPNSSLAGSVYIDTNGNGIRDPGEIGVPGGMVTLTGTDVLGRPVFATVKTDANGNYLFFNILPGTYTLTQTPPPNLLDRLDRARTVGGIVGNDITSSIPVGPQQAGTNYEFGEAGLSDPSKFFLLSSNNLTALFGPPGTGRTDVSAGTRPPTTED